MKRLLLSVVIIFLIGCSVGSVNQETTQREQPFAVETMRGNVAEATRCVGHYWQKSTLPPRTWWKINPESLPILASGVGIGSGTPPVSLVIDFSEEDGKTIARAYMHGSFQREDQRRAIAIGSLTACRDNSQSYYGSVKGIVLKSGAVIEGQIISIDHDVLKIRIKDGAILSFSFMNDVKNYLYK